MALQDGLSSRNPFVRKATEAILRVPKFVHSFSKHEAALRERPPVFVNSVPKSGTHLLMQIVDGLPDRVNYGAFLSSMTSSFQFRTRSEKSIYRFMRQMLPREIIRGHLYYDAAYEGSLAKRNVVHFFIYRDPRDVVLSGAHYARTMNRWHRLHRYFSAVQSMDDAITLAIQGLSPPVPGIDFPDIGTRYRRYSGWIKANSCFPIRFEELQSENRLQIVQQMARVYAAHSTAPVDVASTADNMLKSIAPSKSHTFRRGEKAGWRKAFTAEHRRLFHEVAGDLLVELGYEKDGSWVELSEPAAT